jgi:predicted permease
MDMNHSIFYSFLFVLFLSIGLFIFFGGYARLYFRGKRFNNVDRPTIEMVTFVPNNGFIGFPVAITFFGDMGLFYMIANNVAMSISIFTYGLSVLKRGRDITTDTFRKSFLKGFRRLANPNVSAAIAGIILSYLGVKLPNVAIGFLDIVSLTATPMAMIAIRTILVDNLSLNTIKKRAVIEPTLNKLFVLPLMAAVIVWFLPLDPLAKTIIIVANSMPTAAVVGVMCEQYKRDYVLACENIVIATLISMVTIPFAIWILGAL